MSDIETMSAKRIVEFNENDALLNVSDYKLGFNDGAQHQAAQTDNLAEALEPFVQQYAHISDEELENVSGKFFFERMMNARTALKAYRGE